MLTRNLKSWDVSLSFLSSSENRAPEMKTVQTYLHNLVGF
jgi:hypothetical protein